MNRHRWKIAFAVLMLGISGCASTQKYESVLNSWLGHDAQKLVNEWGYPTGTFRAPNGNEVYVYERGSTMTMPSQYRTTGNITPLGTYNATTYQTGGQTVQSWCKTFMELNSSKTIVSWRWEGNACRA